MLQIDRQGSVVIVRQAAGENRFNPESLAGWHQVLDELDATHGPLALITTGEGKFYSNGLDLDWLLANADGGTTMMSETYRLFGRILGFHGLTVAAVNGHAFGGGAILASVHDYVVMRNDRGYWCMPEADLGLPLTVELHAALQSRLPPNAVNEAINTGKRYTGPEALAAGLVHALAGEHEVVSTAVDLVAPYADKDRSVIGEHKRLAFGPTIDLLGATRP